MVHMIKKKLAHMDWKLLIPYFILSGIGILMVYSSSSYRAMTEYNNSEHFFYRQIVFAVLGMFSMFFISLLSNRFFKRKNIIHAALVLLFLVMFYLIVAGTSTKGARGWIYISSFGFQPAEFIKVVLIMYLALFISGNQAKIKDDFWQTIKKPGIVSLLAIALIFIQPDLGGAAIISFICLVLFLHSGIPLKYGVGALGFIMASYFSLIALVKAFGDSIPLFQSYQMARITSFINPFADSQNSGYQVVNSYYALSRGGLFGVGIGESIQKSGYLPEAHTDFILSIIGEELGLLAIIVVLSIFFYMVYRMFRNGLKMKDPFAQLVCIGTGTMFLIQGVINIGGATGVMPLTGVTFPFVSYGGSSMLVSAVSIGIVNNMYINDQVAKEERLKK
jgi:cell division protein FtsW